MLWAAYTKQDTLTKVHLEDNYVPSICCHYYYLYYGITSAALAS